MCWNCRGAGNREFLCKMIEMMKEFRPSIVVLLKPRISGLTANDVCAKLGRRRWIHSEAAGFNSGIWRCGKRDDRFETEGGEQILPPL